MDFQLVSQRREEMLREAELSRRVKALRAVRKRRDGRRSALVWEIKRYAGRLLKLLRALRNAGQERRRYSYCGKEVLFPGRTERTGGCTV